MSLPGIPSRPAPPSSYSSYPTHPAPSSRPEFVNPAERTGGPANLNGPQTSTQQLPSLRTLLEPQLLDSNPSDRSSRQNIPQQQHHHSSPAGYGSSSPTLKRRYDYDSYNHGFSERTVATTYPHYLQRPPPSASSSVNTDNPSTSPSTLGSVVGVGPPEMHHRGSFGQLSQHDTVNRSFRPSSATPDIVKATSSRSLHEEYEDASRPLRRRIEGISRAPVRASRCVAQREVPGEGLCYIYEDGTYCRVMIDGEAVNPSWGITKAGKPRKRLAQACLTCREKKIKCEPGYPKCLQCAKSQRICKGGMNQPSSGNALENTSPSSSVPMLKNLSAKDASPNLGSDRAQAHGELPQDYSPKIEGWNAGPSNSHPITTATSRNVSVNSFESDHRHPANDLRGGMYQDHMALQWEQDPYETDANLTLHLLDLYFQHAGRATYGMFPRRPFVAWVQTNRKATQDDRMLLYSVLAMGSLFSADSEERALGKRFAAVASYATAKRFGKFSLQLCQSRLMLALFHFAQGKSQEAWDFCGAGLRAISALNLNTEEGVADLMDSTPELEFGFDRRTYEECCRRTFWSGFLMDRYNGFFGGTLFVVSIEDAYVRLPCVESMYEAGSPCETPLFDYDIMGRYATPLHGLGHMAYLCLISTLWGDVLTFTTRAARKPDDSYARHYEGFYNKTNERLQGWLNMLPTDLRYSQQNLDKSILEGYVGTFMSVHALFHATTIRLNRQVRLSVMSAETVSRNIEQSFRHASDFVGMMHTLAAVNRKQRLPTKPGPDFYFSTPFPGYALMLSIDVLSSAGTLRALPNTIDAVNTTVTCIDELADFWASARAQQKAVSNRLRQLTSINFQGERGIRSVGNGQFWRLDDSLDVGFGINDVIYKVDDQMLFNVVGQLGGR